MLKVRSAMPSMRSLASSRTLLTSACSLSTWSRRTQSSSSVFILVRSAFDALLRSSPSAAVTRPPSTCAWLATSALSRCSRSAMRVPRSRWMAGMSLTTCDAADIATSSRSMSRCCLSTLPCSFASIAAISFFVASVLISSCILEMVSAISACCAMHVTMFSCSSWKLIMAGEAATAAA